MRHTYLSAVIGMVVQASFGGDIKRLAENDSADLLLGRDFRSKTGLQGVVESVPQSKAVFFSTHSINGVKVFERPLGT